MNEYQIESLVTKIAERFVQPAIPFDKQFMDLPTVAKYLCRTVNYVRSNYACLPDFPKPFKIKGGNPLYKASEIHKWVEGWRVQ